MTTSELHWLAIVLAVVILFLIDKLEKFYQSRTEARTMLLNKPPRVLITCGDEKVEYLRADLVLQTLTDMREELRQQYIDPTIR